MKLFTSSVSTNNIGSTEKDTNSVEKGITRKYTLFNNNQKERERVDLQFLDMIFRVALIMNYLKKKKAVKLSD